MTTFSDMDTTVQCQLACLNQQGCAAWSFRPYSSNTNGPIEKFICYLHMSSRSKAEDPYVGSASGKVGANCGMLQQYGLIVFPAAHTILRHNFQTRHSALLFDCLFQFQFPNQYSKMYVKNSRAHNKFTKPFSST